MNSLKKFLFGISRGDVLLPHLKTFLLKEQVDLKAGKIDRSKGVIDDANLTIACFRDRKAEYNHQGLGDEKTKDYFHPSQIGRCPRQHWFDAMGASANVPPATGDELLRTHLIFEIGTYAHVMIQNLCDRAGVLEEREVQVVDHVNRIVGHCDARLNLPKDGRFVFEFKTINARGFAKLTAAKIEHIWQAMIYCKLLKLPGAIVLYFNKDTQEMKEFRVAFNEAMWVKTILPRIVAHARAVKLKSMPLRIPEANPHKFPCSYCMHQRVCFDSGGQAKFLKSVNAKALKI